jgi:hypothetical protein
MLVGTQNFVGSWGRNFVGKVISNAIGIIFIKIKEELNTCSWGCKVVVMLVHKIHENWSLLNNDYSTVC